MGKFFAFVACLLAFGSLPIHAEDPVYYPRIIQFTGVPEYTQNDLLAIAQLKPGGEYTVPQMTAHGKLLMDTGLFSKISYTFNGVFLVYTLAPSPDLIPIKNANLPLPSGKELNDLLSARIPLYHGMVPGEGGVCEQVRTELEKMLAEKGLQATVTATAIAGTDAAKTVAMHYAIAEPAVKVGTITVNGGSAREIDIFFGKRLAKISGTVYESGASEEQIRATVAKFYSGNAYVDAKIDVKMQAALSTANSIQLPFSVAVTPGKQYTLTGITAAPGLLMTQAEMDQLIHKKPGNLADFDHVQSPLSALEMRYHRKGQVAAKIHATPTLNRAASSVHYNVTVNPGPVYRMGKLDIAQIQPDIATNIMTAWKLQPGAVFDEAAILQLLAVGDANPLLARTFTSVELRYNLTLNDEDHTVDVQLRLIPRDDGV